MQREITRARQFGKPKQTETELGGVLEKKRRVSRALRLAVVRERGALGQVHTGLKLSSATGQIGDT